MTAILEGGTCSHCGGPQKGIAGMYVDGREYDLCHPDDGLDCYRLVTVYKHPIEDCTHCSVIPNDEEKP